MSRRKMVRSIDLTHACSYETLEHRDMLASDLVGMVRAVTPDGHYRWFLDTDGDPEHEIDLDFGQRPDIPMPGIWADDGVTRPGVARPGTNGDLHWFMDTNSDGIAEKDFVFGLATDFPVVGDWDGDGKDNVGVVRPGSNGYLDWFFDTDEDPQAEFTREFGFNNFAPVVGNWEGAGLRIGAVQLLMDGNYQWHLDQEELSGGNILAETAFIFGTARAGSGNDRFLVGDWNDDGRSDVAVVHQQLGQSYLHWVLDQNRDPTLEGQVLFGNPGDFPVAGKWSYPEVNVQDFQDTSVLTNAPFNIGTVTTREPLVVAFKVTNTGNRNLEIGQPATSSNVELNLFDGPMLMPPNGSIQFEVAITTTEDGPVEEWVRITTNDSNESVFNLRLVGQSSPQIDAPQLHVTVNGKPLPLDGLLRVDSISLGEASPQITVRAQNTGDRALTLTQPSRTGNTLILQNFSDLVLGAGEAAEFVVAFDVQRGGVKEGGVTFRYNGNETTGIGLRLIVIEELYIAFDGYSIDRNDLLSWHEDWGISLPTLDARVDPDQNGVEVRPFMEGDDNRGDAIKAIISNLRNALLNFSIRILTLGPSDPIKVVQGVTTVFVGPSSVPSDTPHIAVVTDSGNRNSLDIAFVGEEDWGTTSRTALAMANVILHETGHTYGLEHVVAEGATNEAMWANRNELLKPRKFSSDEFQTTSGLSQSSFRILQRLFGDSTGFPDPVMMVEPFLPGDATGDGRVDFADFLVLSDNFGGQGAFTDGDFDADGAVTFADFLILAENFGLPRLFQFSN